MQIRSYGAAEIASSIRRQIAQGSWSARDRLPPERIMAADFGVARGTVREALRLLAKEGLVEVRRGSGSYIRADGDKTAKPVIQQARPLELIDARFALEPHICRLAVLNARGQDLNRTERLLQTMEASLDNPTAFAAADTAFHSILAEMTGNNLLIWIIGEINAVRSQEQWSLMLEMTNDAKAIGVYNAEHRKIVETIRNRDSEAAAQAMKRHLETARMSLMRAASA